MADTSPVYFWKADNPEYGFLCQWYTSPFTTDQDILPDGKKIIFRNAEQYMMYRKALHFSSPTIAQSILSNGHNPRKCKALGRSIPNYTDASWDPIKSKVVEEGSYYKFTRSSKGLGLREKLLETGDRELVEASPYDRVWGVGFDEERLKSGAVRRESWGENLLGRALMGVRERVRREEEEKQKMKKEGEEGGAS